MKIYTRTGDQGTTGLFGGPRVLKAHARIDAYGTTDELNAVIGVVRTLLDTEKAVGMDLMLKRLQDTLFVLGADLATPLGATTTVPRIEPSDTLIMEEQIDRLDAELPELRQFILPAGSASAAQLHVARTVCRRAERHVVALIQEEAVNHECVVFLNRTSDFLFVAARWVNMKEGNVDEPWSPGT